MLLNTEQVVGLFNFQVICEVFLAMAIIALFAYYVIKYLIFLHKISKHQRHECKCVICGSIFYDKDIKVVCDKCLNKKESNK